MLRENIKYVVMKTKYIEDKTVFFSRNFFKKTFKSKKSFTIIVMSDIVFYYKQNTIWYRIS